MAARPSRPGPWKLLRVSWDRITVYLPIILMGLLALGTYWLVRNTPGTAPVESARPLTHEPDYFMRGFSVKTFDAAGRLKSEVLGSEARHYPDTGTTEVDLPRIRSFNARGELTVATARMALSNADGSEVQLIGDAVVTREAATGANGQQRPRLEFRGEFLHVFLDTERIKSHKPVTLKRGDSVFVADSLEFDNLDHVLELRGHVRGTLVPAADR